MVFIWSLPGDLKVLGCFGLAAYLEREALMETFGTGAALLGCSLIISLASLILFVLFTFFIVTFGDWLLILLTAFLTF